MVRLTWIQEVQFGNFSPNVRVMKAGHYATCVYLRQLFVFG